MNKPLLNLSTEKLINIVASNLPQSLLLTGDYGIGLYNVAVYIAHLGNMQITVINPEKDEKIDYKKGIISVESIRRLKSSTHIKTDKKHSIIIDYADTMPAQAQNAFLKLLEEPSDNIHFILVAHNTAGFLPTILSRVEIIKVKPITKTQSETLLDTLKISDITKRSQILFMAMGLPDEIIKLSTDNNYLEKRSETIRDARDLLKGTQYQKLIIAHKYKDDRDSALTLLQDASKILEHSLSNSPQTETIKVIDKILNAQQQVIVNGNIRLCIARLAN